MSHIIEEHKVINVGSSAFLDNSSIFANPVSLDVVNLSNWRKCIFIVQIQNNIPGDPGEIAVKSCNDAVPTTKTNIPFKYRHSQPGTDTYSAWREDGLTEPWHTLFTAMGSDQIYEILVSADDLVGDDHYVCLNLIPAGDPGCMGSVIAILFEPRYAESINATVLV